MSNIVTIMSLGINLDIAFRESMKLLETEEGWLVSGKVGQLLYTSYNLPLDEIENETFESLVIEELMYRYITNHVLDHTVVRNQLEDNDDLLNGMYNSLGLGLGILSDPFTRMLHDIVENSFSENSDDDVVSNETTMSQKLEDVLARLYNDNWRNFVHTKCGEYLLLDTKELSKSIAETFLNPAFDIFGSLFGDLGPEMPDEVFDESEDRQGTYRNTEIGES